MKRPRALIVRAPGTNCDEETEYAFALAGAESERVHLNRLIETPQALFECQILCIPGGFSYGDDIAAGRIFSTILRTSLGDALRQFRDRGGLILGICNGFQVLLQTGLLIDRDPVAGRVPATLTANRQGRFENRWVYLRADSSTCVFLRRGDLIYLPMAHGEGNFVVDSPERLGTLERDSQIALRYVDKAGRQADGRFPENPNGAMGDVAGLCDKTGRVFALMPHPERHLSPYHHPRWTRRDDQPAEGDGLSVFRNAVKYFH